MSLEPSSDREGGTDDELLAGQLAVTEAENERLRREFARIRQTQYRRTALGLGLIGVFAALGAVIVPSARTILFALGGTGLFASVLTYYLTPERFIAASVGEEIYAAVAANESAITSELGLAETRLYVPTDEGDAAVRLYIPQDATVDLPPRDELTSVFVVTDDTRGLSLHPTGASLFEEFDRALTEELSDDPTVFGDQLADGLVEQFELVQQATPDIESGRLTVAVTDSAYGAIDRFDHPVPSFVAVGTAHAVGRPIQVTIQSGDGERADHLVTCSWEHEQTSRDEA